MDEEKEVLLPGPIVRHSTGCDGLMVADPKNNPCVCCKGTWTYATQTGEETSVHEIIDKNWRGMW